MTSSSDTPEASATDRSVPALLRPEIEALDDRLHELLMRRAELAARGEGAGPGAEAATLRRLLARHAGPLPRPALARLWREVVAATSPARTAPPVTAWLPDAGIEVLRAHLGLGTQIVRLGHEAQALAAAQEGRAARLALPAAGTWWRSYYPSRLRVTARLPLVGTAEPTVFLLAEGAPDPSGEDVTLVRLRTEQAGLAPDGLAPRILLREGDLLLVELPGLIQAGDVRLAALGATVLGGYAAPIPV